MKLQFLEGKVWERNQHTQLKGDQYASHYNVIGTLLICAFEDQVNSLEPVQLAYNHLWSLQILPCITIRSAALPVIKCKHRCPLAFSKPSQDLRRGYVSTGKNICAFQTQTSPLPTFQRPLNASPRVCQPQKQSSALPHFFPRVMPWC